MSNDEKEKDKKEEQNNFNFNQIISGKNVNFLFGSGASRPACCTLSLGGKYSFEDIISSEKVDENSKKVLYYYFYCRTILPMFDLLKRKSQISQAMYDSIVITLKKYIKFIEEVISYLRHESNEKPKRVNIFTTNYDLMFEKTFQYFSNKGENCFFNDGGFGFIKRVLNTDNYNLSVSKIGILGNFKNEIPVINLIKMHGSVSWYLNDSKGDNQIEVQCYANSEIKTEIIDKININSLKVLEIDESILKIDSDEELEMLNGNLLDIYNANSDDFDKFYNCYKKLLIINPNKNKFYETVFKQQYYQQLRNFTYELEKENTILIVFGFSFADEHIREIVRNALSNPTLKMYVVCYDKEQKDKITGYFAGYKNFECFPDFEKESNNAKESDNAKKGDFDYLNSLFV